ncbi:MAG: hypothetical protein ABIR92_02630 [Gemmatimonadaceae bacterium]
MSRSALVGGYAIIAAVSAAPLLAQTTRAIQDRLERQVAIADRAQAAYAQYSDSLKRLQPLTDTFTIAGGIIRVATHRDIAPVVRDAASRADSILREVLSVLPVVTGSVVTVRRDTTDLTYGGREEERAVISYSLPPQKGFRMAQASVEADAIARSIEEMALGVTLDRVRNPFFLWRRGGLPLREADRKLATDWSTVRYDLLATRSLLGPRCYKGEIPACAMILGLTTVDDPVMAWYDSLARVDEIRNNQERALRFNRADTEKCLQGDDDACGRALHSIDTFELPPAGGSSRDALVRQAILMGGDGAVERLIASRGTPADAIASAAKVPIDSVLRVWQRRVQDGSLGSDDLSVRMGLVAIGWIALMLALSTRISRWR